MPKSAAGAAAFVPQGAQKPAQEPADIPSDADGALAAAGRARAAEAVKAAGTRVVREARQEVPAVQYSYDRRHPGQQAGAGRRRLAASFAGEPLRRQLAREAALCAAAPLVGSHSEELGLDIPAVVGAGAYHTIAPLDAHSEPLSAALGIGTLVFKGVSAKDGLPYALYRLEPSHAPPTREALDAAKREVARWAPLGGSAAGVLVPRNAFLGREAGEENALWFAYDYIPGAQTLEAAHSSRGGRAPDEERLWSYLCQGTAALAAAHASGLALGPAVLHPAKALVGPDGRLRLPWCGVRHALGLDDEGGEAHREAARSGDVAALGRLVMAVALRATPETVAADVFAALQAMINAGLSKELGHVLLEVAGGKVQTADAVAGLLGGRLLRELQARSAQADALRHDMTSEVGAGRLVRLLVKLDMVLDRYDDEVHSYGMQAGDKHMLRCFRDFVFHQVREGRPALDWGHVVEALNKLDVGAPERVMLASRENERSVLVASYGDVRASVEAAYADLERRAGVGKGPPAGVSQPSHGGGSAHGGRRRG